MKFFDLLHFLGKKTLFFAFFFTLKQQKMLIKPLLAMVMVGLGKTLPGMQSNHFEAFLVQ